MEQPKPATIVAELKNIRKSYLLGSTVLDGLNLKLEAGKFYALLGQNGAGKSTLMRLLMRYETPDSGEGHLLGFPLDDDSGLVNAQVGFVTESIDYAVPSTLRAFVSVLSRIYPNWDQTLFDHAVRSLEFPIDKNFHALSRGQRMQVATAVAIAARPKLLLLDEITSVFDARARNFFLKYLKSFAAQGGTVVLATNIVSEVHHYAEHLILIEGGRIRFNSPVGDISRGFIRLKRSPFADHPIFDDEECTETGIDPESENVICVIPVEAASRYNSIPTEIVDHRRVTAEEAFIYFTRGRKRGAA